MSEAHWSPPDAASGEGRSGWAVEVGRGSAAALHGREVDADVDHAAWFLDATGPAMVLGSTQDAADLVPDLVRSAIAVVRRRSGGGAVLVGDGGSTWLDLVVPRGSPLWDDDVGRAMHWVGDLWVGALADLGVGASVHRGPLQRTEWSRHICFAGRGPGEVLDSGGRKIVGVSQRRTRHAARFQSISYHREPWAATVANLALGAEARARALADLTTEAGVVDAAPAALRDRLIAHLPRLN